MLVLILTAPGAALADSDDLPYSVDLLKPQFDFGRKNKTLSDVIDEMLAKDTEDEEQRNAAERDDYERKKDKQRQKLKERWLADPSSDSDFTKSDFDDLDALGRKDTLDGDRSASTDRKLVFDRPELDDDRGKFVVFSLEPDDDDDDDDNKLPNADSPDDSLSPDKEYRSRMLKDERKTFRDLTRQVPGMLQDWVPDKPNRLHNGGFSKAPDNGFPVPYKLNGWIDIQRKFPWEEEP